MCPEEDPETCQPNNSYSNLPTTFVFNLTSLAPNADVSSSNPPTPPHSISDRLHCIAHIARRKVLWAPAVPNTVSLGGFLTAARVDFPSRPLNVPSRVSAFYRRALVVFEWASSLSPNLGRQSSIGRFCLGVLAFSCRVCIPTPPVKQYVTVQLGRAIFTKLGIVLQ